MVIQAASLSVCPDFCPSYVHKPEATSDCDRRPEREGHFWQMKAG
jgi:hypothetical protein